MNNRDLDGKDEATISGRPLQFLLTDDGEFVREILTDEVAKGIDAGWRLGLDDLIGQTRNAIVAYLRESPLAKYGTHGGSRNSHEADKFTEYLSDIPTLSEEQDKEQVRLSFWGVNAPQSPEFLLHLVAMIKR